MISEFIRQIIELDNTANEELVNIDKEVEEIQNNTLKEVTELENQTLENFRGELQENYDIEVAEAEALSEQTLSEANIQCTDMFSRYERIKESLAKEVVEALFTARG